MVTGIVKDSYNKPLQYVNIYESDKNGSPLYTNGVLKGTTSNKIGLFSLNINKPLYYITASFTGMQKQTLLVVTPNQFLNFTLKETELPGITVTADRIKKYGWLAAIATALLIISNK